MLQILDNIQLKNTQRPGVTSGLTLGELGNASQDGNSSIVTVHNHKTKGATIVQSVYHDAFVSDSHPAYLLFDIRQSTEKCMAFLETASFSRDAQHQVKTMQR